MQVKSYNAGNVGEVEFDETPFLDKTGKGRVLYRTLKDAVVMFQANQRQGTASTRGRSEVRGTNKKPYRQKHTGRARAGDRKSPIWRGGGTVFGPKPRDWSYHMPKKARRVATRSALLGKLKDGEVVIADLGEFPAPSAKAARKVLADLGNPRRALVVVAERDENVWKSFRNFPGVCVRTAAELCAYDVIAGGLVIAESGALEVLATRLAHGAGERRAGTPKTARQGRSARALARKARAEGQAAVSKATAEEYPVFSEDDPTRPVAPPGEAERTDEGGEQA